MDSITGLQRAVDGANAVIRGVREDDLTKPTPCTDWDVRALVNHMAGVCIGFTAALDGTKVEPPPRQPVDVLGSDPGGSYASISRRLLDAWQTPGALERTLAMPIGDLPGAVGINIVLADQLLHTWDLAKALGRPYTMDADLAETTLQMMQQMMRPEFRGPGQGFAEAVPCAEDAPVQERLVAFAGRKP
ncbi:MAG: TIGR03086 family protein [Chloroflexi bacterium]|nr:TIGR03086 family protein [Chloroflexota bacterium]